LPLRILVDTLSTRVSICRTKSYRITPLSEVAVIIIMDNITDQAQAIKISDRSNLAALTITQMKRMKITIAILHLSNNEISQHV
jgi:hypothetical protein